MSRLGALVALALAGACGSASAAAPPRAPWLVVSDIHYATVSRFERRPSPYGFDTNLVLFDSLLAQLRRDDPDAPVIVIAGDFLAHGSAIADAASTMAYLARRFDAAFPHAQFVITLGNNDSDCGDYETTLDGPFLRAVAKAWEPLVNRHGAAPDFVRTFSHDGGYVATLPAPGLRAVVVNDVYDSIRYRNRCGTGNPAATSLGDLNATLRATAPNERAWLVTHVPPGVDAFSTAHLAHRFFVVPFLRPGARDALLGAIDDPANHVALVIAGHTHHFAFRLSDASHPARDVPILVAPSVSPIFLNAPSYLTLDVGPRGDVGNVAETSFLHRHWARLGDLASQGVPAFTAPDLERYESRLEHDGALEQRYRELYSGGSPSAASEISAHGWRVYWCAATELGDTAEDDCMSSGGLSVLTGRGLRVLAALAVLLACAAVAIVVIVRRRRRARSQA